MNFIIEEATISDIHNFFKSGNLTAVALTQMYLERISNLDQSGPELNTFVKINPEALNEAKELDDYFSTHKKLFGPLHGVPIAIKDQIETKGLETSFGSVALKGNIPDEDATLVTKLKLAGAIIIGKTTMPDFAASWWGYGSVHGETKCAYDLERDSGGSSGGTGSAIAANLATVGIGEDTGGSIRLPSGANNLVGLRVTPGLISRNGLSPLLVPLDTPGPMGRTVEDVAKVLDVLVGYDPKDPYTVSAKVSNMDKKYTIDLEGKNAGDLRLGFLKEAFGPNDELDFAEVNKVVKSTFQKLQSEGAHLVELSVPNLQEMIDETSLYISRSRSDLNNFFKTRSFPFPSIDTLVAEGRYEKKLELLKAIVEEGPINYSEDPDYYKRLGLISEFQQNLQGLMAKQNLDGICYPACKILTPKHADLRDEKWTVLSFPTNTTIASQSLLPSICVPAGFSKEGVPVGLEIISYQFQEHNLLKVGSALERCLKLRRPPHFGSPKS